MWCSAVWCDVVLKMQKGLMSFSATLWRKALGELTKHIICMTHADGNRRNSLFLFSTFKNVFILWKRNLCVYVREKREETDPPVIHPHGLYYPIHRSRVPEIFIFVGWSTWHLHHHQENKSCAHLLACAAQTDKKTHLIAKHFNTKHSLIIITVSLRKPICAVAKQ